ncbi:hypothetical protein BN903_87 [Halorubrum sp. AJ67]|nr:hypothetical protein BN903_87 [Halorubrum sp. AJ67]
MTAGGVRIGVESETGRESGVTGVGPIFPVDIRGSKFIKGIALSTSNQQPI